MTKPLSNVQLEIPQSFNYELSQEELSHFRAMLVRYFADKISDDINVLFEERDWGDEKIEEWSKDHLRTPYKNNVD